MSDFRGYIAFETENLTRRDSNPVWYFSVSAARPAFKVISVVLLCEKIYKTKLFLRGKNLKLQKFFENIGLCFL